jgi:signal transduction histidine kinase
VHAFVETPLPPALGSLWSEAQKTFGPSGDGTAPQPRLLHAIREEIPAIVAPVPHLLTLASDRTMQIEQVRTSMRPAYTIIVLDEPYLKNELLPLLASRAFSAAETSDYHVTVRSRVGNREVFSYGPPVQEHSGAPDISLPLLDVRLDTLADLRAAALGGKSEAASSGQPAAGVQIDKRDGPMPQETHRFTFSVIQRQQPAGTANRFAMPGPQWTLEVRHRAGSLEAAVASTRRRNLALSAGVLLLFGASISLLVLSVQRASRLASQQIEFVAAVSHELRTPLAVIRSAGENLADGLVREPVQVKQYGELVRNEGLRLSSMVEQVLAFAGMRGDQRLQLRAAKVSDVITQAIEGSSADLKDAGLNVEVRVPADLPAVNLDVDAVARALINLLTNAAKYGRDGGHVVIAVSLVPARKSQELRISVTDRGPGIADEDLPHIFEPFYRSRSVIASRIHGTGLGLSLVEAIARAHGGWVSVERGIDRGSTFTLHLPFVAAPSGVPAGHQVAASRS